MTKYEKLADYLRREHIAGQPAMTALPSIPTLMRERKLSQATVDRALNLLVDEGLVRKIQGVGCFTTGAALTTIGDGPTVPARPATPAVDTAAADPLTRNFTQDARVTRPKIRLATVAMPGGSNPVWDALAAAFQQAYPRVELELAYVDMVASAAQQLLDDPEPLDVIYCPPSGVEPLVADGLLASLEEYPRPWAEHPVLAPRPLSAEQADQVVPYSFTTRVVLGVAERLAPYGLPPRGGWDWTEFLAFCERLRADVPADQPYLLLDNYEAFLTQWGISLYDDESLRVTFDGPAVAAALEALRHLYQDLKALPLCSQLSLHRVVDVMLAEQPALCIGRTPWATRLEQMGVPPLAMWPVPLSAGGYQDVGVNYLGIYRYSRYPDLAWALVDFVCSPAGQAIIERHHQEFPLYATSSGEPQPAVQAAARESAALLHRLDRDGQVRQEHDAIRSAAIDDQARQLLLSTVVNPEIEAFLVGEIDAATCMHRVSRQGTALIRNSLGHRRRLRQRQAATA